MVNEVKLKDMCINDIDSMLYLDEGDHFDIEDLLISIEVLTWRQKNKELEGSIFDR